MSVLTLGPEGKEHYCPRENKRHTYPHCREERGQVRSLEKNAVLINALAGRGCAYS